MITRHLYAVLINRLLAPCSLEQKRCFLNQLFVKTEDEAFVLQMQSINQPIEVICNEISKLDFLPTKL